MMAAQMRRTFALDPGAPHVLVRTRGNGASESLTVGISAIDRSNKHQDEGDYEESEVEVTVILEDYADATDLLEPDENVTLDGEEFYVLNQRLDDVQHVCGLKRH